MATRFVSNGTIDGAPNDSNNGLDPLGIALAGAVYDDVGAGAGSHYLSDGTMFSGYSWVAGDQIYLSGSTITDGLYEIASKVDDDGILLVESAGADDSNVASSDGPLLTIQAGVDAATGGDDLIICGSSTYTPAAQIDFDTNLTTEISYVRILGATARGVVDGTRATLDFTSATGTDAFSNDSAVDIEQMYIAHLNILNSPRDAVFLDIACYWVFENCRIAGSTRNGIQLDNATSVVACYGCEIDTNVVGINASSGTRGGVTLVGCSVHDNTGDGVTYAGNSTVFVNTQFYNNGSDGAARIASADNFERTNCTIVNCTFFNNTAAGLDLTDTTTGRTVVMGSVFRSNATSIDTAGEGAQVMVNSDCCYSDNTSDVALPTGIGNITVDPEFESETGGSEDLEPDSDSPLIAAGFSYTFSEGNYPQYLDMGAIQREMAVGGGGGLLTHPGMVGGMRG